MARLYADEHVPRSVSSALRTLRHDVLTAQVDGRANARISDPELLARATALGRAVLTANRRDFQRLHRADPASHAGIITYVDDPSDRFALAVRIGTIPDLSGRLIRVVRPGSNPPR